MGRRGRGFAWAGAAALLALGLAASPAGASTYKNTSPITINDGAGTPYPAVIPVAGLPGEVAKVQVTLGTFAHASPSDVDVLLVAPSGQRSLVISDACDGVSLGGETLIFDDAAASPLPDASCVGFNGQSFRPTNYFIADVFPMPAPPGPYLVSFSVLAGAEPNGSWNLFVSDESPGVTGTFGSGWGLELLTTARCRAKPVVSAEAEGTDAAEIMEGTPGDDVLVSLGGNDTVRGLGGNDVICGGLGNDKLIGGTGNDIILGEGGKDRLIGRGGKDVCKGGAKRDSAASCEKRKAI